MRLRVIATVLAGSLVLAGGGFAAKKMLQAKPVEFDPFKTKLVQAAWLAGLGCPTDAKTATFNTAGAIVISTFTDPACPTDDPRDKQNEGLLLAKTGPTGNFASAQARIKNVKGILLTELGYDIRKPGTTAADPRGSHCGAGAPRFNIRTADGDLFFLGCNSPPGVQTPGQGWIRIRWGGAVPLLAFNAQTGLLVDITGEKIRSLRIVFDEAQDASGGPDQLGAAFLDNIDVNGKLIGQGPVDAD